MNSTMPDQTEEFKPHKQVLDNLLLDEEIIYKLKTSVIAKSMGIFKYLTIILHALLAVAMTLFIIRLILDGFNGLYVVYLIILPLLVVLVWFVTNLFMKPQLVYLYITNKKIFFVSQLFIGPDSIKTAELADLSAISYERKKIRKDGIEFGHLEFISEKITNYTRYGNTHCITIRNIPDFLKIINIAESILFYHGRVPERITAYKNKVKTKMPLEFRHDKKMTLLRVYPDKIGFSEADSMREFQIEFSKDFFINFSPYSGKKAYIIIKPSFKSSEQIKFGPIEDYWKPFEMIYFHLLSWKVSKGKLVRSDKLEIDKSSTFKIPTPSEEMELMKTELLPDEEILFSYEPKVINKVSIIFMLLSIMGIPMLFLSITYLTIPSLIPFDSSHLKMLLPLGMFMVGMIFGALGPLISVGQISHNLKKRIFTNKRILIKRSQKIIFTSYTNISSITFENTGPVTHVKISLKKKMGGDINREKMVINFTLPKKERHLIDDIKKLWRKHQI